MRRKNLKYRKKGSKKKIARVSPCFTRKKPPRGVVKFSQSSLGTLSLQGCLRNLLPRRAVRDNFGNRNFWQCLRTTQRLARSVGRPKLWHVRCISGLSLELASARLRRESLGCGNFRETRAPRSVSLATRVAKNCGTLASFAACCWNLLLPRLAFGTFFLQGCAAKLLGTKNLAKHWRYAAF